MMAEIIFFLENTFNKRDFHRFGIQTLINHGNNVFVYDFTPLLYSDYFAKHIPPDPININNYHLIYNKKEASIFLRKVKHNSIVISMLSFNSSSYFIFKHLSINHIRFGFVVVGTIPSQAFSKPLIKKILNLAQNPKSIKKLIVKAKNSLIKLPKPYFCITGGSMGEKVAKKIGYLKQNTINIKAHAYDFDRFLEEEDLSNNEFEQFSDYAVMIDEYGPYHPDFILSEMTPYVNKESYYYQLNNFFNLIEISLGLKVIIAAHPRSNYEKVGNPYNQRKVIRGKTIQLIKYSKLVLIHASTALNFVVLYQKPVLFISSFDYSTYYQNMILIFAKSLSSKVIEISNPNQELPKDIFFIDKNVYKNYKEIYIKEEGTPNKLLWEIFSDFCKEHTLP